VYFQHSFGAFAGSLQEFLLDISGKFYIKFLKFPIAATAKTRGHFLMDLQQELILDDVCTADQCLPMQEIYYVGDIGSSRKL